MLIPEGIRPDGGGGGEPAENVKFLKFVAFVVQKVKLNTVDFQRTVVRGRRGAR